MNGEEKRRWKALERRKRKYDSALDAMGSGSAMTMKAELGQRFDATSLFVTTATANDARCDTATAAVKASGKAYADVANAVVVVFAHAGGILSEKLPVGLSAALPASVIDEQLVKAFAQVPEAQFDLSVLKSVAARANADEAELKAAESACGTSNGQVYAGMYDLDEVLKKVENFVRKNAPRGSHPVRLLRSRGKKDEAKVSKAEGDQVNAPEQTAKLVAVPAAKSEAA